MIASSSKKQGERRKTMKRMLVILAIVMVAGTVAAQTPPPAYGGFPSGWGINPNNWNNYTGGFSSGLALWNPTLNDWNVAPWGSPGTKITYAPITLELWIELHMIQTYYYTSYQWHRIGDAAETITFAIDGTVKSNQILIVSLTSAAGFDPNFLKFISGMYGGGNDIPIHWWGRWGLGLAIPNMNHTQGGGWNSLTWCNGRLDLAVIPPCDHWVQFKGQFDIPYHQADGYYKLVLGGCPVPEL